MFGPSLEVRGGVSSIERLLVEDAIEGFAVSIVPTMTESNFLAKICRGIFTWIRMPILLASKPDLIHINFASRGSTWRKTPICLLASMWGVPVVLHAHGAEFKKFYGSESGPIRRGFVRSFLNRASALIVLSDSWKEYYLGISSLEEEKIHVLRTPVDSLALENNELDTGGKLLMSSNGRIGKRKGSFDLIDAFARLPKDVLDDSSFVATGDGEVGLLKKRIESMGLSSYASVKSWLPEPEFLELRKRASIFLLPSYDEGLPMAMIEAMALGQVPIVSPVGGIPEVIVDGENGLLVEPGDIHGIAEAITKVVRDDKLRERLAEAALETARFMDIVPYKERLGGIYHSIIK